jgi:hypothetical protein
LADLDHIRRHLVTEGILIAFHGPFRHSLIEELGKAVKKHLESESLRSSAMADVFSVYIEAAQNVANYTNAPLREGLGGSRAREGVLVIARDEGRYVVHCGNYIDPEDAPALLARLDELATLGPEALKARFKERLRAPLPPGSPGAGLGLVRMARTASRPLAYSVVPAEDDLDFFSLTVTL